MYFSQHYLDCLSQASYLIGDETTGQAVVVDPRRDIAEYLSDAADHGLRIIGAINTHFHADFLSGHLEMARATGAWIGYGPGAEAEFQIRSLADGERITLGEVTLEIMHTPGHTPESISVLVYEHPDDDIAYGVLTCPVPGKMAPVPGSWHRPGTCARKLAPPGGLRMPAPVL